MGGIVSEVRWIDWRQECIVWRMKGYGKVSVSVVQQGKLYESDSVWWENGSW